MDKVYYVAFWDSSHDDRRGGAVGDGAEDFGVWLDKSKAQAKADELNRTLAETKHGERLAQSRRAHARWVTSRDDWNALVAAGRRSGDFSEKEPQFPQPPLERPKDHRGWWPRRIGIDGIVLFDFYEVEEYDLNDGE